jgi:hypothetical protein
VASVPRTKSINIEFVICATKELKTKRYGKEMG